MKKPRQVILLSSTAIFLLLAGSVTHVFSNMIIHPSWHKPGLQECSGSQLEYAKSVCIPKPEDGVSQPFETITLDLSGNRKLEGWFFPTPNSTKMVIFVHGAGADRRNGYKLVPYLQKAGYSVLLYDAPNHGRSSNDGKGVAFGMREKEGVVATVNWASTRAKNIALISTSAGTSAVILSHKEWAGKVDAVLLENPFFSVERLIKENKTAQILPNWYNDFVIWYSGIRAGYDLFAIQPGNEVADFPDIPVLVFHGDIDRTVPFAHGVDLFQNLKVSQKEFFEAKDTDHCRVWDKYPETFESKTLEYFALGHKKANRQ